MVRRDLLRDERIVRHDFHAEGPRAVGDFLPDAAKPDDAKRLATHFRAGEPFLVPNAALHRGVGRANGSRERQHQRPGVFGDAHAVRAWSVHHDDAAVGRGGDVDVIHAGSGAGNHPKPRSGGDQLRVDLRGAANDEGVGIGEVLGQFGGRASGTGIDGKTGNACGESR